MLDRFGALTQRLDISNDAPGALCGKTFVVKENIDVAGYVSTNGHPAFAQTHAPAGRNASAVDRLLASGAQLVGKTHMDEMAYSLLGANHHYGTPAILPPRTGIPADPPPARQSPSLADLPISHSAPTRRAPAEPLPHFAESTGFRPSHGAISSNGLIPLAQSLDTIGWFARDIETMITVGEALLPDDLNIESFSEVIAPREAFQHVEPEFPAATAFAGLSRILKVNDKALGEAFFSPELLTHFRNLQAYEAWSAQSAWIAAVQPEFGPGISERFAYAATVTLNQKQAADAHRAEICAALHGVMGATGLLIIPTTPFRAPLLNETAKSLDIKRYQMMRLFLIASFCGLPQISTPLLSDGAPYGLSLIGPRWSDRRLLKFACHMLRNAH